MSARDAIDQALIGFQRIAQLAPSDVPLYDAICDREPPKTPYFVAYESVRNYIAYANGQFVGRFDDLETARAAVRERMT